ncbi:pirin family protein [Vibrio sp. HA2012]|uniref:pirin family protein n=1 Tax=Vibrio sp. HA2012 TaxID=1971595 RepID=UPI000C2BE582|nr:pirin family protein [Vibrio sp. HA2012]PJC86447.1 pirin family protein [Vibrio sp. HA2012]
MLTLRYSEERGQGRLDWLDSRFSFSFSDYYDPEHMGFSALRVINEDVIQPGGGFATHGHRDMEIITYVLSGSIEHKDSEGNTKILPAGEFQLMSAGAGIFHSEYNPSVSEPLHLLQIWIQPHTPGGLPGYQQKAFDKQSGLTTIATERGENGTLKIKQDAVLHHLILEPGSVLTFETRQQRNTYIHLISGNLKVDQTEIAPGDAAKVVQQDTVALSNRGSETVTALIFDLP